MSDKKSYGSFQELGKAMGQQNAAVCQCGKPKKPSYALCWDCSQKQPGAPHGAAGGGNKYGAHQGGAGGASKFGVNSGFDAKLPANYLQAGYFLPDGYIRDELLISEAKAIAQAFTAIKLSSGQLRRFYAHAQVGAERLKHGATYDEVRPDILQLESWAYYAVGRARNDGRNYELLKDYIEINVEHARKSQRNFEAGFMPHFEAVLAYFKYYNPKDKP